MPDPNSLARWLILLGLGVAAAGAVVWLLGAILTSVTSLSFMPFIASTPSR